MPPLMPPDGGEVKSKAEGGCAWRVAVNPGLALVSWGEGTKKAHFHGQILLRGGAGENRTPVRECSAQSFYRFSS